MHQASCHGHDLSHFLPIIFCGLALLLCHNTVKLTFPLRHKLIYIILILVLFLRNRIIFQFQCSSFISIPCFSIRRTFHPLL